MDVPIKHVEFTNNNSDLNHLTILVTIFNLLRNWFLPGKSKLKNTGWLECPESTAWSALGCAAPDIVLVIFQLTEVLLWPQMAVSENVGLIFPMIASHFS